VSKAIDPKRRRINMKFTGGHWFGYMHFFAR